MLTFLHPHFSHLLTAIPDAKIVRFEKFSDGWPRIFLENREEISTSEVSYIGDFRYVDDFFGQLAFLDGLARYGPKSIDIYVPFFPAASMERDTPSGELSIANVFARALGLIGERNPGNVRIHLYDIHDEREIFYFPSSVQIRHHTTTDVLRSLLEQRGSMSEMSDGERVVSGNPLYDTDLGSGNDAITKVSIPLNSTMQRVFSDTGETNPPTPLIRGVSQKPIILFPDAGAKKAFSRFFTDYEVVTCAKVRKGPTEIEMYFEGGNLEGREVWIIDDHIRSGGTLVEACRYAREKGALRVSAFAPHAVFAEGVKSSFLDAFDHFYTTDTIPENIERFRGHEKVKILPFLHL